MADFSGYDDEGRKVDFYDADEDGSLDRLGRDDTWEAREEVLRRLHVLDKNASVRPATSDEVEAKKHFVLGQRVEIIYGDEQVSGIVVAIEIVENKTAVYKIIEGHQTGSKVIATDVRVYDFFEMEQEPN